MHSGSRRNASHPSTHLGNHSEHLQGPCAGPGAGLIEMVEKGLSPQRAPHPVGVQTQEETLPSSGLCPKQFTLLDSQLTRLRPKEPRHLAAELGGLKAVLLGQSSLHAGLRSRRLWRAVGHFWAAWRRVEGRSLGHA